MLRPRGNWRTPWRKPWGYPLQDWTPAQLFAGGWQGFYTDPVSGLYLFSDTAGTTHAPLAGTVARLDAPPGSPVAASFTNATVSRQPIRRVDGLEFDGVDDYLAYPDNPALRFGTTDFTLAVAVRFNTLPTTSYILAKRNQAAAGSQPGWALRQGLAGLVMDYDYPGNTVQAYTVASGVLAAAVWSDCIIQLDRSAAAWTAFIGDVAQAPASLTGGVGDISGAQQLALGAQANTLANRVPGKIGRILAIDKLLSPADRALVNAWLKAGHS